MPVEPSVLGAFALAAAAIALSPGPDTMLILRYALGCGRSAGFAAVAGVQLGLLVHTALAAAGVAALIASSPILFRALAVAGAVYLAWLGVQGFRAPAVLAPGSAASDSRGRACGQAILCNILNPKVIVLFLALYPNFLDPARGQIPAQIAILSLVLLAINIAWQSSLVLGCHLARRWFARPQVQRAIGWLTGSILLAFAAAMLWQHGMR